MNFHFMGVNWSFKTYRCGNMKQMCFHFLYFIFIGQNYFKILIGLQHTRSVLLDRYAEQEETQQLVKKTKQEVYSICRYSIYLWNELEKESFVGLIEWNLRVGMFRPLTKINRESEAIFMIVYLYIKRTDMFLGLINQ